MSAMLTRVSDPHSYQAFRHFLTHAPWDAERLWRGLRAQLPVRSGVLTIDGTGFPKQGTQSVGVARQYLGTLGKIANCQGAVTAALWTGAQAWFVGAKLYLADSWFTPEQRARAQIAPTVEFQEKWRLALTSIRQVRAARVQVTAVHADAEFGDNSQPARLLAPRRVVLCGRGVVDDHRLSRDTDLARTAADQTRPPSRPAHTPASRHATGAQVLVATWTAWQWHAVRWRDAPNGRLWTGRFAAAGVTPAHAWRQRRLPPEVWLLLEQDAGTTSRLKYYLIDLPPTASLRTLVTLAHQRWAIEQQYQELKDELGLDHFEGRSLPAWNRHVALTALATRSCKSNDSVRPLGRSPSRKSAPSFGRC